MEEIIEHIWRKEYNLSLTDTKKVAEDVGIKKEDLVIFDGPFDLLLSLIDEKKLDILTIKISDIIDQYIAYIKVLADFNMDISSDFIEMAALLIFLKSKEVAPRADQLNSYDPYSTDFMSEPDDDNMYSDIQDLDELKRRLLRYRSVKIACEYLHSIQSTTRFYRRPEYTEKDIKLSFKNFSLNKMVDTYIEMLGTVVPRQKEEEKVKTIQEYRFTIRERILKLLDVLVSKKMFNYFDIVDKKNVDKQEILTTFLAVLELAKVQALTFDQDENENITLKLKEGADIEKIKSIDFEKEYSQTEKDDSEENDNE